MRFASTYRVLISTLQVVSGKTPYWRVTNKAALLAVRCIQKLIPEPQDHENLPPEHPLWKICKSCWNDDPAFRPTIVEVIQEVNEISKSISA